MVTQLAIMKVDGKHYYQDDRLREFRETTNPYNRIKFEELGDRVPESVVVKHSLAKSKVKKLR